MLQRTLGSGWGVLLPGMLIAGMAFTDLSVYVWKVMIVLGLLLNFAHAISQALTAFCSVTFMRGVDRRHCAGNDELESGISETGKKARGE